MIMGVVFVACVSGAVIFLGWLDKQVPNLPVMLTSLDHGLYTPTDRIKVDT